MRIILFLILCAMPAAYSAPKHCRDCSCLPKKEQDFAKKLKLRERKMFCGRFNTRQRDLAMKYARKGWGLSPNEAVIKVMEETGMSLASKRRPQTQRQ